MAKERAPSTAVLLVNLGTPDSPEVGDVRKYLRQFLMDPRVIDIPALPRFLLVNGVIAPFRAKTSARAYRQLWQPDGSPLKIFGIKNREQLQEVLPENYQVFLAMRYQSPGIPEVVKTMEGQGFENLIVLPLFPQYASASSGSAIEEVLRVIRRWTTMPNIRIISQFFDHPLFIETFAQRGRALMEKTRYDHIVFSYHGLPERQILRASVEKSCRLSECCSVLNSRNRFCYRAQCFATTWLLMEALGVEAKECSTVFQSRLGRDPWIRPYADETFRELRARGHRKILVFSPAFVADCLETTIEIGHEYRDEFLSAGGEQLDLVESCNDHPSWVACLKSLVLDA